MSAGNDDDRIGSESSTDEDVFFDIPEHILNLKSDTNEGLENVSSEIDTFFANCLANLTTPMSFSRWEDFLGDLQVAQSDVYSRHPAISALNAGFRLVENLDGDSSMITFTPTQIYSMRVPYYLGTKRAVS
jgi:hypothetical protein